MDAIIKPNEWICKSETGKCDENAIAEIAEKLGIHPVVAKLLYLRGYTAAPAVKTFLCMESEMIPDPFLLPDMEVGVDRIKKAVDSHEKITIFGDFDADGVTSVSSLYLFLQSKGANVHYYIPDRLTEGYGVTAEAIRKIKEDGTALVVTVDTGITANAEMKLAKELGMDVVITDHHECPEVLPNAVARINPKRADSTYPFSELAGVGVVFKLLCAYERKYSGLSVFEATKSVFDNYADLAAFGTVGDVMPIREENRLIVNHGISKIEKLPRLGVSALIDLSSQKGDKRSKATKISTSFISFTLVPRLNAVGRLTKADEAVELFLSTNKDTAYYYAEKLCAANKQRQDEETKITSELAETLKPFENVEDYPVFVLADDNWHKGLIGVVASRITERYSRPCILVTFEGEDGEDSDVGKGSCRSVKGFNMVEALNECSDLLVKYGGHELAAGLSVTRQNLSAFRDKINAYAKKILKSHELVPTMDVDMELPFLQCDLALAEALSILEPFGSGNPQPLFTTKDLTVLEITGVSEGKHTRLILGKGNKTIHAMFFSRSPYSLGIYVGDTIDVVYQLDVNEWLNVRSAQLIIRDLKKCDGEDTCFSEEEQIFNNLVIGKSDWNCENYLPIREDFVQVYKQLFAFSREKRLSISFSGMLSSLKWDNCDYIKLRLVLAVFEELKVMTVNHLQNGFSFGFCYPIVKTNLEDSVILSRLRKD